MSPIQALLDGNAKWAHHISTTDPTFFPDSAKGQQPKVLWIGCADSRVPETLLTGARPGDIFVHRNIANQFHPGDDSAQAILAYAVGVVGVQHVVLAGHTQCGGAAACYDVVRARSNTPTSPLAQWFAPLTTFVASLGLFKSTFDASPLGRWLAPLTDHVASLDLSQSTPDAALNLIVRENVKRQVSHICDAEPIKQAWAAGKPIFVHGWVYDLASGKIQDLGVSRGPDETKS